MSTMVIAKSGMKGCGIIVLFLVLVDLGLNMILVPKFHANGAAVATALAWFAGLIISSVYLIRQFNIFADITSLIRIAGVSAVIFLAATFFKTLGLTELILKYVILGLAYLFMLRMVGEISTTEMDKVKIAFASGLRRLI